MLVAKLLAALLCSQFTVEVAPSPTFTVTVEDSPAAAAAVPRKRYLAMFTASYCGPCQPWKRDVKPQLEAAGHVVQVIEMTDSENQRKYGQRISRVPTFVVCDWETGEWLSEPRVGVIDFPTATALLVETATMKGTQAVNRTLPVGQGAHRADAPPVRFFFTRPQRRR